MRLEQGRYVIGENVDVLSLAEKYGTPTYVYDFDLIRRRIDELKRHLAMGVRTLFLYAIKANFNPHLVRKIIAEGMGIEAVSPEEARLALMCGAQKSQVMYTETGMNDEEMYAMQSLGVLLNIGSLSRLEKFGAKFPESSVCVRFNPNVGAGSHHGNVTGGPHSKFGISYQWVDKVLEIVRRHKLKLVGIHEHIGSGWLGLSEPILAMDVLLDIARQIPDLQFINLGGGFGIPYKPDERSIDLEALGGQLKEKLDSFCSANKRRLEVRFEPGRFVVAEAGQLLTRVNAIKPTPHNRAFLEVDTGMYHLARPALYGSYHGIVNVSNPKGAPNRYDVVGQACECADVFAENRELPEAREGDLLSLRDAGAYGFAMASNYQFRPRPAEIMVDGQCIEVIRERETLDDLLRPYGMG